MTKHWYCIFCIISLILVPEGDTKPCVILRVYFVGFACFISHQHGVLLWYLMFNFITFYLFVQFNNSVEIVIAVVFLVNMIYSAVPSLLHDPTVPSCVLAVRPDTILLVWLASSCFIAGSVWSLHLLAYAQFLLDCYYKATKLSVYPFPSLYTDAFLSLGCYYCSLSNCFVME